MMGRKSRYLEVENEKLKETINVLKYQVAGLKCTIHDKDLKIQTQQKQIADLNNELAGEKERLGKEIEIYKEYYRLDEKPTDDEIMKIRLNLRCYDLEREVIDLRIRLNEAMNACNAMNNACSSLFNQNACTRIYFQKEGMPL